MTTAQKIQRDLVRELLSGEHLQVKDVETVHVDEIYLRLKDLGIGNAKEVRVAEIASAKSRSLEALNSTKQQLHSLVTNPLYGKTITFTRLCKVLEKYDLVIGKASDYIKEIPLKNAKEIVEYCNTKRSQYYFDYVGVVPLPTLLKEHRARHSSTKPDTLFICGSIDNFRQSKDRHLIGREVIYNSNLNIPGLELKNGEPNPDPIVLNLILTGNHEVDKIGIFDIVTAWDREAKDPEIFNEKLN